MAEETSGPAEPQYRPVLAVYVVWHPNSERGQELASKLFAELALELDIPVFFRSAAAGEDTSVPLAVPIGVARHSALFILADTAMVLAREGPWGGYLRSLFSAGSSASSPFRVVPVLLEPAGQKLLSGGLEAQGIRVFEQLPEAQPIYLVNRVVHELCRLLLGAGESGPEDRSPAPVKLFLSHAKADGLDRVQELKRYIEDRTVLKNFFDASDIAPSYIFGDEIEAHLKDPRAALLVLLTDAYATRPWCRREVLLAKRFARPVAVVHAVDRGEARCFPYLGNVPALRVNRLSEPWGALLCEQVLQLVLREILRQTYLRLYLQDLGLLGPLPPGTFFVPHPPELLTSLYEPARPQETGDPPRRRVGLYPDPPLGDEELEVLERLEPGIVWLTPTLLPLLWKAR